MNWDTFCVKLLIEKQNFPPSSPPTEFVRRVARKIDTHISRQNFPRRESSLDFIGLYTLRPGLCCVYGQDVCGDVI